VVSLGHSAKCSGGELALARAAPYLRSAGIRLVVVLGEDGPLVERLSGVRTLVHPLPGRLQRQTRGGGSTAVLSLPSVAAHAVRLARVVRRERADVIHCNTLKAAVYGSLAARIAGVPAVWHLHDLLTPAHTGSAFTNRLLRIFARVVPQAVIANSGATASTVGLGVRPRVIHDGAPVPREGTGPAPGGPTKAIMVGRLAAWKGQDVAIQAVRIARAAGHDVRLTVAGAALFEADHGYERSLKAAAGDAVRDGWLTFVGFVDDVGPVLRDHHVAIHASRLPEPFGQVVVEAMSHGLPVIAARAGGPVEIMTGDLTALLAEPGDARSIADRLILLQDPDVWRHLAACARRRAGDFTVERSAALLGQVFRELSGLRPVEGRGR
jgi:glycosyltransferase involved in cell wall biosynthesis